MLGHSLKLLSVYLLYKAVVETSFTRPYNLLLRDLTKLAEALCDQRDFAERLIETAPVMVLVLNREGLVVRFNPELAKLTGYNLAEVEGRDFAALLVPESARQPFRRAVVAAARGQQPEPRVGVLLSKAGEERQVEWQYRALPADGGLLAVGQDVTERNRASAERELLIAQLQQALSEVKMLSGLLPICASCKRVRDNQGYWQQVEEYLGMHSEAQFTHGICPECMDRLYGDLGR